MRSGDELLVDEDDPLLALLSFEDLALLSFEEESAVVSEEEPVAEASSELDGLPLEPFDELDEPPDPDDA